MQQWDQILAATQRLADLLIKHQMSITTAESCTGGGVSYALTSIDGSSKWFEQGVVSYADHVKNSLLHVKKSTLLKYGAVSEQAAQEMLEGALETANADTAIAITGYAGAADDIDINQAGKIFIGTCIKKYCSKVQCFMYNGSRNDNRQQAVYDAIVSLVKMLEQYEVDKGVG